MADPIRRVGIRDYTGLHAFRRDGDENDLLVYTKIDLNDPTQAANLTDGTNLPDPVQTGARGDYGLQSHYENDHDRLDGHTYDQWYIDQNNVTYFLNDDGFLVARYYSDYNYTGPM
jgi:hypothetical protein